jgi:hypothetical protein
MEFKEWNLDKSLYYFDFNLITLFHFQYFDLDPKIFGYNNILMIFLCVSIWHCFMSNSIFIPFHF